MNGQGESLIRWAQVLLRDDTAYLAESTATEARVRRLIDYVVHLPIGLRGK